MNENPISHEYAPALIRLLRGVVYADDEPTWKLIRDHEQPVRSYFETIGLTLHWSEADGYAFLRQDESETNELPQLVRRVPLNYPTTLLCVLLRERLLQHDAGGLDSPRLVVTRQDMIEAMLPFLKERVDETRTIDAIHSAIIKLVGMGFITPLKSDEASFEVRRILKAHLTADKLAEIKAGLDVFAEPEAHDEEN